MKKILFYYLMLVAVIVNTGCGESAENKTGIVEKIESDSTAIDSSPTITDQHTSANSLDWAGIYKGVLPCADCEGIATQITLNKDSTYSLTTSYLGKSVKPINQKGSFSWSKAGNIINLGGTNLFLVGENNLTQLDKQGNKINSAMADKLVLLKQAAAADASVKQPDEPLVDTYWKLTELMGKPVAKTKNGVREFHMILKKKDNSVSGFAGCNNIMGTYELKDGNSLRFTKMASTLMACDDMKTEDDFKKVLGQIDNYSIDGKYLLLTKGKAAPLAKFKAAPF